jgi:hypothetical protein
MKTANPAEKAFDNILDVYEQLGHKIPLLYEYMRLFDKLQDSRECLVYIYQDILTFHQLAYKLFSLRTNREVQLKTAIIPKNANPLQSMAKTV